MVFRKFSTDETGAIAPLYALALFGLIGMAGVGFDYARVMALDTELQNAADQAALAAASQLDGKADSIDRAQSAVTDYFAKAGGAYVNKTRLSNIDDDADGDTRSITQVSFAFWEDYVDDQPTNPVALDAADSSDAEVVQVTITQRALRYALTPIVGAIVGRAGASAMASVESAFCKVPPLMVCVPNANFGANDATGTSPDRGTGVMLHMLPNSKSGPDATDAESVSLTPGIFGFLDFPYPSPVGGNPNTSLGWEVANPSCTGETVDSEPGVRSPEAGALASRFDVGSDCQSGGTFCPSSNTTKNRVYRIRNNQPPGSFTTCPQNPISGNTAAAEANGNGEGWVDMSDVDLAGASSPGYPRDTSHNGNIGNKVWDIAGYFSANYNGSTVGAVTGGALSTTATRYDVYKWQQANPSSLQPRLVRSIGTSNPYRHYCAYPKPIGKHASMTLPTTTKDRRVLSLAAVDCAGLNGRAPVNILRYVDVFLVEPPLTSASDKLFYVEVIGETSIPGGTTFQTFAKRKAVLLR